MNPAPLIPRLKLRRLGDFRGGQNVGVAEFA
jgi:hypothetical protein